MKSLRFITTLFITAVSGFAFANTLPVSFTADASSRVEDNFSNAYAQVGLSPQGMYDIDTNEPRGEVDPFPFGANWAGFGTLTLSGTPTLLGSETFGIDGASFDVDAFADAALWSFLGGYGGEDYTTVVTVNSGSVSMTNGVVDTLSLDGDVSFLMGGQPSKDYTAASGFLMSETALSINVNDTVEAFGSNIEHTWDITGTPSFTVIPEPSGLVLLTIGLGVGGLVSIIRRKKK